MSRGVLLPLLLLLGVVAITITPTCVQAADTRYYDVAIKAANWIVATGIQTPTGVYWPDSLIGQNMETYNRSLDLYSGVAGTVIYLFEAHRVSGNATYLTVALKGLDYILARLPAQMGLFSETNLYHGGVAGLGWVLDIAYNETGDIRYNDAASRVRDYVIARGQRTAQGLKLHNVNILRWGQAGLGLYLLDSYQRTGNASTLQSVVDAASWLLAQGVPAHGGLKWFYQGKSGMELPNYADGASGVGYFFITVYHFTKDPIWLQAARSAATYLLAIANLDNEGCLITWGPSQATMFYLGECNGPTGTGRFWIRMYQVTGEAQWLKWARASGKSIIDHAGSGPFNWVFHSDGTKDPIWDNKGICDGASGAIEYFTFLYRATLTQAYFDYAGTLAADVIARGTAVDNGMMWITEEWRTSPVKSRGAQVGYMQGAAGIGSVLLGVDEVYRARQPQRIHLPDAPFNFGFMPLTPTVAATLVL